MSINSSLTLSHHSFLQLVQSELALAKEYASDPSPAPSRTFSNKQKINKNLDETPLEGGGAPIWGVGWTALGARIYNLHRFSISYLGSPFLIY